MVQDVFLGACDKEQFQQEMDPQESSEETRVASGSYKSEQYHETGQMRKVRLKQVRLVCPLDPADQSTDRTKVRQERCRRHKGPRRDSWHAVENLCRKMVVFMEEP